MVFVCGTFCVFHMALKTFLKALYLITFDFFTCDLTEHDNEQFVHSQTSYILKVVYSGKVIFYPLHVSLGHCGLH